jgi:hypothetical protein
VSNRIEWLLVALEPGLSWQDGELQMSLNRLVLGVLLLGLSGQAHAATGWETFVSQYSGCSVEYPSYIFTPIQQTGADGATRFTSGLAEAAMVIAGGANEKQVSIADIVRIYLEQVEGESITYRRQEQGWAVYSGYRGGLIYYLKAILSKDRQQACVLELRYPVANKLELDVIVSRISKSLRLPQSGVAARELLDTDRDQ